MNPAPAAKSILLHLYRLADTSESEFCTAVNYQCLQSQPSIRRWQMHRFNGVPNFAPLHKNAWYLVTDTASGPTISEVFNHLPQDELIHSRKETSCVKIGSHLYDIGGRGTNESTKFHYSNKIRRLDTEIPSAGWKTLNLPVHCRDATAEASGNFIYLFPNFFPFVNTGETSPGLFLPPEITPRPAYVYDTIRQEAYTIEPPFGSLDYKWHRVCAPLDHPKFGSGLLVPILDIKGKHQQVYFHKPEVNSWEPLVDYAPIPGANAEHYAVLNEVLYVCDRFGFYKAVLYVYDLQAGCVICKIDLPEFGNYNPDNNHPLFVVPMSDSELCFLWSKSDGGRDGCVFYAKVSLSIFPPAVEILNQAAFNISLCGVLGCIPLASRV